MVAIASIAAADKATVPAPSSTRTSLSRGRSPVCFVAKADEGEEERDQRTRGRDHRGATRLERGARASSALASSTYSARTSVPALAGGLSHLPYPRPGAPPHPRPARPAPDSPVTSRRPCRPVPSGTPAAFSPWGTRPTRHPSPPPRRRECSAARASGPPPLRHWACPQSCAFTGDDHPPAGHSPTRLRPRVPQPPPYVARSLLETGGLRPDYTLDREEPVVPPRGRRCSQCSTTPRALQ